MTSGRSTTAHEQVEARTTPAGAIEGRRFRIVALAPHPWNGPWMNRQHLLSRLGRFHWILYSQGLYSVWDRQSAEWKRAYLSGGFREQDNVITDDPPKLLLRWPTTPWWDNLAIAAGVARWRRRLTAAGSDPLIAHIFHPEFAPFLDRLGHDFLVYHPYDLFSLQPGWTPILAAAERRLVKHANLVVATSRPTCDALQGLGQREVMLIENAADFEQFSAGPSLPLPVELTGVPRPRIGYVGSINRKVDLRLIGWLATRNPAWHFVLVGRQFGFDQESEMGLAECKLLSNVHFLGEKPPAALPALVGAMDVNLMCYRTDGNWMSVSYPLKLHEYLSTGKPVVSSPVAGALSFPQVVAVARSRDEWEKAIRAALEHDGIGTPETRRSAARANSWDHRVSQLNEAFRAMVG